MVKPSDDARPLAGGLRARKKQQTRRHIAEVAAKLFKKRGFENVRMIDIAAAADVSEQTVYNYFPTKEHLIFDQDKEFEKEILGIVIERDAGLSLGASLRLGAFDFLDQLSRSVGKPTGVPASVATSVELRRVWIDMNARHGDALTDALIKNRKMSRPTAKFVARSIVALFAVIMEGVGEGMLEGKSPRTIVKELRSAIESITDKVERGLEA